MEAKEIYTLKDKSQFYVFDTKAEAEEFCNQEAEGLLRGGWATRLEKGMMIGVPAQVRDIKEPSMRIFKNVVRFGNEFRVVAHVAWIND